jgi:hypothetical protein
MTVALFEEVFSNHVILAHVDRAFTPTNFAVNRRMVAFAAEGFLLIDGFVCRNIDMDAYKSSRFAKTIKIRRIEWPTRFDPAFYSVERGLYGSECMAEMALMVQILRDNAQHVKEMVMELTLDRNVCANVSKFLEALSECTALEMLGVVQRDVVWTHAREGSIQVKLMEAIKKLPNLRYLDWNGNMTEERKHAANEEGVATHVTLCDYLPRSLTHLGISDFLQSRLFLWTGHGHQERSSGFKALMSNEGGQFSNIECLKLPSSFWCVGFNHFEMYMDLINAGKLEVIGFADEFKLKGGREVRVPLPHSTKKWNLPSLRLYSLLKLLTRGVCVDLGDCKDATERQVRLEWAASLEEGEHGFHKFEREEMDGHTAFSVWKKYTGPDEARRGSEFEVVVLV